MMRAVAASPADSGTSGTLCEGTPDVWGCHVILNTRSGIGSEAE